MKRERHIVLTYSASKEYEKQILKNIELEFIDKKIGYKLYQGTCIKTEPLTVQEAENITPAIKQIIKEITGKVKN